jgi:hypothetical protein
MNSPTVIDIGGYRLWDGYGFDATAIDDKRIFLAGRSISTDRGSAMLPVSTWP